MMVEFMCDVIEDSIFWRKAVLREWVALCPVGSADNSR